MKILFSALVRGFTALLGISTGWAGILAAIVISACTLLLPVVIHNGLKYFGEKMLQYVYSIMSTYLPEDGVVITLTGVGAYLGDHLQVQAAIAVLLSALSLRLIITIIS